MLYFQEKRNLLDFNLVENLEDMPEKWRFDTHCKGPRCRMEQSSAVESGCGFTFQSHKGKEIVLRLFTFILRKNLI